MGTDQHSCRLTASNGFFIYGGHVDIQLQACGNSTANALELP